MNTVYKYCGGRGVAILENLELKITPPNQFNDPFEFTPRMICSDPLRRAKAMLSDEKRVQSLYQMLKDDGKFDGSFRDFQNCVIADGGATARGLSECIPQAAASVQPEVLNRASTMFGILCLSKRRDSISMWGHYCEKYQGLVIGLDGSNVVFQPGAGGGLRPVNYIRERVVYDATWDESDPKMKAFDELVTFSKNEDWSYEEEVRQRFQLSSLKQRPLENGTTGYFLPVPPEAIVSVTLGARCSAELEGKVRSALAQLCLSHVKIDRAMLDKTEFALNFAW